MAFENNIYRDYFCTNCGTKVNQNDRYCPICGNRIDDYADKYTAQNQHSVYVEPYPQVVDQEKKSSTGRILGIIGSLTIVASVFLPYVSYNVLGFGESKSLMDSDDGIIFLIAAVLALLLFCVRSKVLSFLITVGVAVLCFIEYQSTMEILNELGLFAGLVDKEIGFYMIIIGTVFMGIGSFINLFED